tara:strand:- start:113 stop:580 length:468 start_codon:yes stop_codon:yes gene_type:complete
MSIIQIQDLGNIIFDNSKYLKDQSYRNMLEILKDIVETVPTNNHSVYAYLETNYIINEDETTEELETIVTHFKFIILLNKNIFQMLQDDLDISLKLIMNNNLGRIQFKEMKKFMTAYSIHCKKLFNILDDDLDIKIKDTTINYLSIESLDLFWKD